MKSKKVKAKRKSVNVHGVALSLELSLPQQCILLFKTGPIASQPPTHVLPQDFPFTAFLQWTHCFLYFMSLVFHWFCLVWFGCDMVR